ncbi:MULTISPECIES: MlaD family protein [unclassified Pseudomonas]|uniref:MlaD family protein n=1 Tax=unclassified Pseudomonas TaxID=196821 RepID=UPI001EDCBE6E|nr:MULTISPECIES: MlaD family protein [unclassified Pseudomonas]MCG4452244.1 MlaD family protein [Pseudomonas sp. MMS21 TM103]
MSEARKPFMIGAFLLGGLALLAAGLLLLSRDSWFSQPNEYAVYFTGALDGLDVGADVTYRGVKVGTVREIRLSYDPELKDVLMPVVLRINTPERQQTSARGFDQVIGQLVERGLRAQLQTPSLLTGKAIVALDMFPDQAGYVRTPHELDLPTIPSVPSRIDEIADVLRELAGNLRELPLQEMVVSATRALQSLEKLTSSAELQQGLVSMSQMLVKLDRLSGRLEQQLPPIMANVQQSSVALRDAVGEIRRAAQNAAQALQQINDLAADSRRSLGPESEVQYEALRALQELSRAGKALQRTMEGLDQQPQSLIFGKSR